jgi:hypothetical protein
MINNESINLIERSISDTETELQKLAVLKANAAASQETINRLESDLADLGINKAGLEQKVRASRLTSGIALLTLERGDLATFNVQIDNQTDRIIQFSGRATGLLQELWSDVLAVRKASIDQMIRRTFDVDRILVLPIEMLVTSAHCVIEIEQLDSVLFQYRTRNERDLALNDARELRARSASLIAWAKDLPDEAGAILAPAPALVAA